MCLEANGCAVSSDGGNDFCCCCWTASCSVEGEARMEKGNRGMDLELQVKLKVQNDEVDSLFAVFSESEGSIVNDCPMSDEELG